MDASQEDIELQAEFEKSLNPVSFEESKPENQETSPKKSSIRTKKVRSRNYQNIKSALVKNKAIKPENAIKTLLSSSKEKFDTSFELHLEMKKESLSGSLELPHSAGKEKKVVIFDEEILSQIESKKINFDILIAKPTDMPKLAKFARILGPKGLMPNPKNGTITPKPEESIKDFSSKKISYKTEKKAPLIHLVIGKKSLGEKALLENLNAILLGIDSRQIKKAHLCTSMSPSLKLELPSNQ